LRNTLDRLIEFSRQRERQRATGRSRLFDYGALKSALEL